MTLLQLKYVVEVAAAGTISGAARELHMTQPPLSYQMKMLEEELQVAKEAKEATEKEMARVKKEKEQTEAALKEVEESLKQALGSEVNVAYHDGKGKLTVHFYSDDQLKAFANLLGQYSVE